MGVLQQNGVRYGGASVNRTMFSATQLLEAKFNDKSNQLLASIERLAGKDCLTKGYAKLLRLGSLCGKDAEKSDNATAQDLIQYVLEALDWHLRTVKMFGAQNRSLQSRDWL